MENKINLNDNKSKNLELVNILEQLSIQQLLDCALDSFDDPNSGHKFCKELINRGKDNIQSRILIKKSCKAMVAKYENLLNPDSLNGTFLDNDKKQIKIYKNNLLISISILDKLQLEWQKYDLSIKH